MYKRPMFLIVILLIFTLFTFAITNIFDIISAKHRLSNLKMNIDFSYIMGKGGGMDDNEDESNEDAGEAEAEAAEQTAEIEAEVTEAATEVAAEAAENATTTTVKKSANKHKGKTVYTPKYYHTVRMRLFESDWITLDVNGLAYSNDPNSRNRFGKVTSMVTFNLHKLWERNRRNKKIKENNKEMKQNLDYAVEHYKLIQQEDGSWLIKER